MSEIETRKKRGINAFVIRVLGLSIIAVSLVFETFPLQGEDWQPYLEWVIFPIFAFLLAEGYTHSSDKLRYYTRLLLFAFISEIPYNLYKSGSWLYRESQNGMFTLCLGFIVIFVTDFVQKRLSNMIISGAVLYLLGLEGYKLASLLHLEFASFGIMIAVLFWLRTKVSYPKLLMVIFLGLMIFYLASDSYIIVSIGNLQYTLPHRSMFFFALVPVCMYNGEHGPKKLWLQIASYCAYPVILWIMYLVSHFVKI